MADFGDRAHLDCCDTIPYYFRMQTSDASFAAILRLFRAHAESLPFSLAFQGFERELAGLPAPYVPPGGCLLLVRHDDITAGVVGLKFASGLGRPLTPPPLPRRREEG